jgi:DNA-directed RNA polymerase subunit L
MKINVIKDETNELIIEFETSDLTIPDLIANQLQQNDDVEFAGVAKDHPEVGKPRLVLKTSKKKAKETFLKAIEQLDETMTELKSAIPTKGKGSKSD